jgi:hypothetical protein
MAWYVMVLRVATSLRGALEGVGPENRDFFGPKKVEPKMPLVMDSPPSKPLRTAHINNRYINPILPTWFRDSRFTCDGSPPIHVFPLLFHIGMVIYHTRVFFQMGDCYAAIHRGGRAAYSGGWGQSDDS